MIQTPKDVLKRTLVSFAHTRNEARRRRLAARGALPREEDWSLQRDAAGRLLMSFCDLGEIASEYGTPLQVVHGERLRQNFRALSNAFSSTLPRVEVGYSYKTNPLPCALQVLHEEGAAAEVISHFELWLALRLGVPGSRIVFNGPGKTKEAIRLAVQNKVRIINVDNVDELPIIDAAAAAEGHIQPVGVRVVTSVGWSGQFGLPISGGAAMLAFQRAHSLAHVEPCGLHIHLGTGIKSVASYAKAVQEVLTFADMLRARLGIEVTFFDLGGGFGVPTVAELTPMDLRLISQGFPSSPIDRQSVPSLDQYAQAIGELFAGRLTSTESPPTVFFEPGRAITSSAQVLLLTVLATKPSRPGQLAIILDGGRNVAFPAYFEHHEIFPVRTYSDRSTVMGTFYGPLCHPADVLFRNRIVPQPAPGDVIAAMDSGAYFINNQTNFSNPRAAVALVDRGTIRLARRRENFAHIVSLDDAPAVADSVATHTGVSPASLF